MDTTNISIWRTAGTAWNHLIGNFGDYLRLGVIPLAFILAANVMLLASGLTDAATAPATNLAELLGQFAVILAEWVVWLAMVPAATAWTRMVHDGTRPGLSLGPAERAFALRHLMIILLIFMTVTLSGRLTHGIGHALREAIGAYPLYLAQAASLPVSLAGLVIALRLSMLLPAAALRQPLPPRESWRLVRARELTVTGTLIAVSLPFIPLQFLVALATDAYATSTAAGVGAVAIRKAIVLWLAWPVWAAALALLYARLTAMEATATDAGSIPDATTPATPRPHA